MEMWGIAGNRRQMLGGDSGIWLPSARFEQPGVTPQSFGLATHNLDDLVTPTTAQASRRGSDEPNRAVARHLGWPGGPSPPPVVHVAMVILTEVPGITRVPPRGFCICTRPGSRQLVTDEI
jgi:hypothetical protein